MIEELGYVIMTKEEDVNWRQHLNGWDIQIQFPWSTIYYLKNEYICSTFERYVTEDGEIHWYSERFQSDAWKEYEYIRC